MTQETTNSALLSDSERIDLLQQIVFDLSQHAAHLEGALNVFGYLMTANVLRRAGEDGDPYEWLQNYVSATALGCRLIDPKIPDPTTRAHVQRGAEIAADGFLKNLLKLSGDLDGAPKGPRANV
jgi:hypothetical protein